MHDPRVLFAAERTLLAWSRTSLALIAFGFLIERSGLLMKALAPGIIDDRALWYGFLLGLGCMLAGAFSALYSSRQYAQVLKGISPQDIPPGYSPRGGMVVNLLVAALGVGLAVGLAI